MHDERSRNEIQTERRAGPRDDLGGGGGALKAEVLNRAVKAARWVQEGYERGMNPPLIRGVRGSSPGKKFKIYESEKAFQAILQPIFPFSITSILSKVRHSNTLFFAINFSFPCHPLDALARLCYLTVALHWPTVPNNFLKFFD